MSCNGYLRYLGVQGKPYQACSDPTTLFLEHGQQIWNKNLLKYMVVCEKIAYKMINV
jgi:hypothetical protein